MVEKLTTNQIKLIRALSKLSRASTRRDILKKTQMNVTSLQFAIIPLRGYFINVEKQGNKDLISLTKAGEIAVRAFNLANKK